MRPARCPECGHYTDDQRIPPPPSLFHWRIIVPGGLTLAAIALVAFIVIRNAETFQSGSGSMMGNILEPPFTLGEVRAIAAGEHSNRSLVHALLADVERRSIHFGYLPGDRVLSTGFFDSPKIRNESLSFGWPRAWYTQTTHSLYDDAIARSGFRPMRTLTEEDRHRMRVVLPHGGLVPANASIDESGMVRPRPRWSSKDFGPGYIAYRRPPEETGGVAVWQDFNLFALASALGVIAMGWAVPAMLVWFLNVLRGKGRRRLRARSLKLASIGVTTAVVAWLVIASVARSDTCSAPQRPVTTIGTGANTQYRAGGIEHTTLRVSQLHDLAAQGDGDQRTAQAILMALREEPSNDDYLALAITPEAVIQNGTTAYYCRSWPLLVATSVLYARRTDLGSPDRLDNPAGLSWDLSAAHLRLRHSRGDPNQHERSWTVNTGALGMLLLGLFLLWLISVAACRFACALITRRRRRRNQCIACGHALGPQPT
jgi:hypothetical protein